MTEVIYQLCVQHPRLRNRPVHVERGRVEMQLLYYADDDQPPETMSSVFSVYDGEEKMRTGGARSALIDIVDIGPSEEGTGTRPDYLVNRVPKKLLGNPGKKIALKSRNSC